MSPNVSRDERFARLAAEMGIGFADDILPGGRYVPAVRCGNHIYMSGQVPKVAGQIVVQGAVGGHVSIEEGKRAARICAMRALALLAQSLGQLESIEAIPKIVVYVQSAPGFAEQSIIADAASDVLWEVLQDAGAHARTAVGVLCLPRNAAVEVEMVAIAHSQTPSART